MDVFGVYYKNLKKTEIETVGVEVKIHRRLKSADFGQAKGYSIFAHKIYFASMDEFDDEDIEIAKYLGLGLINITKEDSGFVGHEVMEPPLGKPIKKLLNLILERRNVLECQSCKTIQERNCTETKYSFTKIPNWTRNEVKKGKDLLIKNIDENRIEFYCNTCAKIKII